MKVGGKIRRRMSKLRWMDRVQSDMKEHQLYTKLAHIREAWRNAVMLIDPVSRFEFTYESSV